MKLYTELAEYYYDIEKSGRKFRDEVDFLNEIFKRHNVKTVLDMGCGSGEHVVALQQYGYKITGVDSSPDMIKVAKKRFPNCNFEVSSMQEYVKEKQYDGIYCIFGTFNYLVKEREIDIYLENTRKNLKPAGISILEIWNAIPIKKIQRKPLTNVGMVKVGDVIIKRNRGFKLKKTEEDPTVDANLVEVNFIYNLDKTEVKDKHMMRVFTMEEIIERLKYHKFELMDIYGNYRGEKYKNHGARIILVTKKK